MKEETKTSEATHSFFGDEIEIEWTSEEGV